MPLIEPGQPAPSFTLADAQGASHSLAALQGQPVVLYFYPRDATPGCTTQACALRDAQAELATYNAVVLGISPDDAKAHAKFTDKQSLNFPLLIDPEQTVATQYGVWQEKTMYGKTSMGIVRTTYLINAAGQVAQRWDKVKVGQHLDNVLAALKQNA